jgi:hypothetical protein
VRFILIAGVQRYPLGRVGLHRPAFDPDEFAGLSPATARGVYNRLVQGLRQYYVDEMGGSLDAFQMIMNTASTSVRYLEPAEKAALGIAGEDPAFSEYNEAIMIKRYGRERWGFISSCWDKTHDFDKCVGQAFREYPNHSN